MATVETSAFAAVKTLVAACPTIAAAPPPFVAAGVVCDLDGTLIDTEPLYYSAYAAVAAAHGHAYSFEIHRHLLGRAEHEGAANLIRILSLPLTLHELLAQRDVFLLEGFRSTSLLPGALTAMRALRAAGLRMAIATSSCRAYLELKRTGHDELFNLFDAVVCGDDAAVGGHSKPHPAIFLAGAASIGCAAADCLAIEDSVAGIASAVAAGMRVVAVPDPRLEAAEVAAAGAHVVLASLAELCVARHAGVAVAPLAGAAAVATDEAAAPAVG